MKDSHLEKISKKIEALLFYVGDFVSVKDISSILEIEREKVLEAITLLKKDLEDRGVVVLEFEDSFSLGTLPEFSDVVEKILKNEFQKDISEASLQTLSVILYKAPVTKKEIEYIRGVNCSFSLRNLLLRGLIERKPSKLDERIFLYSPTSDCLLHLGVSKVSDIPEYLEVKKMIDKNIADESDEQDYKEDGNRRE